MCHLLILANRRDGLSREAFVDAYETRHAPLVADRLPELRRYARRYLTPVGGPTANAIALPYDVMAELTFDSPEDYEAAARRLTETGPDDEITRGAADLFDLESMALVGTDEHTTLTPPPGTDIDRLFQAVTFLRRRPGMTREAFIDYYETEHSMLAAGLLSKARHYSRRYFTPVGSPLVRGSRPIGYDAVNELWFDSAEDFGATMAELSQPDTLQAIAKDEEKLFDRSATRLVTAEVRRTR